MADPARRRATYEDVLNSPPHLVAEVLFGTLYQSPRPAMPHAVAEAAGMVLGQFRREADRVKLTIDAMVVAFAAICGGGIVYTSDVDDLSRLRTYFPSVRVLSI